MSETPDITNLFRSKHDSWDPDSELGSIIYLTREPITKIPTKAAVIARPGSTHQRLGPNENYEILDQLDPNIPYTKRYVDPC